MKKQGSKYKTKEICSLFDISKATLFRWEVEGRISKVHRDWRNWRLYSEENIAEIKSIVETQSDRKNNHISGDNT